MYKIKLLITISILLLLLTACSTTQPEVGTEMHVSPGVPAYTTKTLKVMTLNLAHGRKDGLNQLLQSKSRIQNNLEDISAVLNRLQIDVVALQEADAPSLWSGNFNHVALLADQAGYSAHTHTSHASSWLFSYGTALLSRLPFSATLKHTFQPSPPTLNKGYTLGQIVWQPDDNADTPILLDIVSVHLDFSRKSVREQQAAELSETLTDRGHPMIIMGDFNSDWFADEKVIRALTEKSGFHVYRPEARDLGTYSSSNRRLDWILISTELEFRSLTNLPDILSDHLAVIAEIAVKESIETKKQ
jgi:endonuclease/exonuclease/phosphatase family metal-dependent hydrolase